MAPAPHRAARARRGLSAWALLLASALWGCECGPGVSCRADDDCGGWGRCVQVAAGKGYCAQSLEADAGDPGPPRAGLAAAPVDFGLVPCGRAPVTREVTLQNLGGGSLGYAASAGTSGAFTVTPAQGALGPGESVNLVLAASAAATATAGAEALGQLLVTTSDPERARFEVPLSMRAAGVTLALAPGVASFGVGPVGAPAPAIPLALTNTGNLPATLTFAQPGDAQFSLSWSGAPQPVILAPGAAVDGLAAAFTANKTAPSSTSSTVSVAEAVCGASVVAIPMTGQGTNGSVGLSTTDLFFGTGGRVSCGAQSPSRTLTLRNTGNQAYGWTATLGQGASSPFTVNPASGLVPASGGQVTLTVSSAPIPAEASTAEDAFGDTLFVVTDVANDVPHPIALHQTASGARLSFAPAAVDFGLVRVGTSAAAPFAVVNDGNAAARLALSTVNPKFTLPPGQLTAPAGASTPLQAAYAPGATAGDDQATAAMAVDPGDVLCAPLPAGLELRGTGTNGSVSYAPAALDFGAVNCGSAASPRTVTFRNDGNQSYTVSAALGRGAASPYDLALAPADGVAAPDGGTVVLTVTPRPVPQTAPVTPNFFGDTLTVTTDVAGDTPHDLPLRQTARGAIFALSSSALSFGSVAVGVSASAQFSVTNDGNAAGTLTFTPVQSGVFTLPATAQVGAGASTVLTAQFAPPSATTYSDMAAVGTSATVLCAPLPASALSLDGTGTNGNVVALSASSLTFGAGGLVPCGTTASARTVEVTNNSSQTLSLAYALGGGAGSPFDVSGPASMSAGQTVTVTVSPKPIPATASTAADAFGDTLTITSSGGPVNEPHTVALRQTAQGAVLSFNPTALSFSASLGGSQSKAFTVNNTGNLAAPFTLSVGGADASSFSVAPLSANAPAGGSANEQATFNAPLVGFGTRSASVGVATSVTRCAPLPGPLTLSATIN